MQQYVLQKPSEYPTLDESTAVVLIDMQDSHIQLLSKKSVPRLIRAQKKFLLSCAERDVKVIVIEYVNDGPTTRALQEVLSNVPRLRTIRKDRDDAFEGSGLQWLLEELGVTTLILTGINASSCVFDTAESGHKAGYNVSVVGELMADWDGFSYYQKYWHVYRCCGMKYFPRLTITQSAFNT